MPVRVGGITFSITANVSQATRAFANLGKAQANLQNNLRQTRSLFGSLGNNFQPLLQAFNGFQQSAMRSQSVLEGTTRSIMGLASGTATYTARTSDAADETENLSKKQTTLAGTLASAAAAFGGLKLVGFIKDATLLAARVQNLGTVLDNVGRIAGRNSAQLRNIENSVKALGITTRSARQSLTQLAQANLDLRKATQLTRIAQDAAVIAGVDSSEAFNRLVVSIQRNDVRLLRNLGIVINLNNVYAKFAQQTGRTAASLTAFEKRQLLLNEVIEKGALIQGTYEASLGDVFKRLTSMRRLIEEATRTVGEQFIPVLEVAVDTTSKFLKEFAKGTSIISARSIGVIGSAAAALLGMAAAAKAVTFAFGSLTTAGALLLGPAGWVAKGIALLGVASAAWVDYKLRVQEARAELKRVETEAENTAQAIVDQGEALQKIRDAADQEEGLFVLDPEELAEVRSEAAKLAQAFPELAEKIIEASQAEIFEREKLMRARERELKALENRVEQELLTRQQAADEAVEIERDFQERIAAAGVGTADAIVDVFRDELPIALEDADKRISLWERKRIKAADDLRMELTRLWEEQLQDRISINRDASGRAFPGELARVQKESLEATARAQRDVNAALEGGIERFIKLNPTLANSSEKLKELSNAFLAAASAARQTSDALVQAEFERFETQIATLEQAANQAAQIQSKLQNQRLRNFDETNVKIVANFQENQNQLLATELRTLADLEKAEEAFRTTQTLQIRKSRNKRLQEAKLALEAGAIDAEDFAKRRSEIDRSYARDVQRVEAQVQQLRENGEANIIKNLEVRRENIEAITIALKQQRDEIVRLNEEAALRSEGIPDDLIRTRRSFLRDTERLSDANAELSTRLDDVTSKLIQQGGAPLLDRLRGLREVPADLIANLGSALGDAASEFIILNTAVEQNQEEILRITAVANEKFDDLYEKRNKRIQEKQKQLNDKLLMLTEEGRKMVERSTLQGLERELDQIDKAGKRVDDFLRGMGERFVKNSKRTKDVNKDLRDFSEQIKNASSPEQLKRLREFFPKVIKERIKSAKEELKKARDELKEFQRVGRRDSANEDREARLQRRNELIEAGVRPALIQQEIEAMRVRQVEARKKKENELKGAVTEAEAAQRAIQQRTIETRQEINKLLDEQKLKVQEIAQLRKDKIALLQQETAEIEKQQALLDNEQRAISGFASRGVEQNRPVNIQDRSTIPIEGGSAEAAAAEVKRLTEKLASNESALEQIAVALGERLDISDEGANRLSDLQARLRIDSAEGRRQLDRIKKRW